MKKVKMALLLFIVVSSSITAKAQYKWFAGGQLGFKSSDDGDVKTTSFKAIPYLAYVPNKHIQVGLGLGPSGSVTKTETIGGTLKTTINDFTIMPFVRYVIPASDAFKFYLQADVPIGFGTGKTTGSGSSAEVGKFTTFAYGFNLRPGFLWIINPRWNFNADIGLLGYNETSSKLKDVPGAKKATLKTLDLGTNWTGLTLGLNYNFNFKK